MASFFSDFGIMWYLEELRKKEFMKFKEFLKEEILQLGLTQVSWTELKKASREDLANLLLKHCEEWQAWDVTFNIFQKLNRKDLIERARREICGYPKVYQAHLKMKLAHDSSRTFNINTQDLLNEKFTEDDCDCLENLFPSYSTEMKPHIVILKGVAGIGKTLILKRLMLAWSKGLVFQNKFSYIFYFCCQDLKQMKITSLAELICREWPSPSAPIEEIVSEPEKLLFIIDKLEEMECDLSKHESELCDNFLEKQPVNVLMSSLLRRTMLPESSILISATPETFEKMAERIEYTNVRTISGFNENYIKIHFYSLFQDRNRAQEAFSLVRENEQLFAVCQVPLLCGMVATFLKNEIEKGRDPVSICRRTTSVYTTHILNLFTPQNTQYPSAKSQEQLQGLCSLAAEGMWTDTFVFSEETLRRNGIMDSDITTLLDIGIIGKISESENSYIFLHPSVQEFCAALFYLVRSHEDHPCQDVKCINTLIFTFLKKVKVQWIFLGCFIFGLLHELVKKKLEAFFGHQLSQEIKHQLYQCLVTIHGNKELQEQIDGMKLFSCLFEMEDEAFLETAVNCVQHVNFVATDCSDIIVAGYCLKRCYTLKKLSFSTQNVLNEIRECKSMEKLLTSWSQICSVLISSKNIQELQIKNTSLSESAFLVLYYHLKYHNCTFKVFKANTVFFLCENRIFFELIQNHSLQFLDLTFTCLSSTDVKLLCDVLNQEECNISKLELKHCNLYPDDCKNFALVLMMSRNLKDLNLSSNNLGQGINLLCKALCHPDCILENLSLASCSLSEKCWDYLSDVLWHNKTLRYLDISYNDLNDNGLKILCKALTLPDCVLKSLCMTNCLITSNGCQDLAEVLKNNQNLKDLCVSNNMLGDTGVKLLCDGLKHPNCGLIDLKLINCEITGASMEDLSSVFLQSTTLHSINLCGNACEMGGPGSAFFLRF